MNIKPLLAALAIVATLPALAQTAYQGTPSAALQVDRFKSPMVIENPFPSQSDWGKGQVRFANPLWKFSCDGITIRDLAMTIGKARKGKRMPIRFDLILANEPGIDKKVLIDIHLVRNGEPFARAAIPWTQVEEGRISTRYVTLNVPADAMLAEPAPVLRVTVQARDDD